MPKHFQVETENENIIDVPFTEVSEQGVQEPEQAPEDGVVINLDEVEYMVMIGRKKSGEIFFNPVQVTDLVVIDSLISYAQRELDFSFNRHFQIKAIETQQQLEAEAGGEE